MVATAILIGLDRAIRTLTRAGIAIAAILILVVAIVITIDVLSNVLLNAPIPVVTELASTTLAIIIFAALAHAQQRNQNVQVDIVLVTLPKGLRFLFEAFSSLVGFLLFALLAWRSIALAATSWASAETAMALIPFPVYPFKIEVAIGAMIAAAEFLREFVWLALTGKVDASISHDPPEV